MRGIPPVHHCTFQRSLIVLQFVQSLSNPLYIHYLAVNKYLDDPAFVAYIKYLEYFRQPEYIKYLLYVPPAHPLRG